MQCLFESHHVTTNYMNTFDVCDILISKGYVDLDTFMLYEHIFFVQIGLNLSNLSSMIFPSSLYISILICKSLIKLEVETKIVIPF